MRPPPGLPTGILLLSQALGQKAEVLGEQSLSPSKREEGWRLAISRQQEREPEAGNGIGAWSSHDRAHQGPRIYPLWASPGQTRAQVSDTWGLESHARKPSTPGPQPPASSSYRSRAPEEEVGLQSREGSTGEGSPSSRVRGWEDKGGEDREEEWGGEDRAGVGRGWTLQERVNGHRSWGA